MNDPVRAAFLQHGMFPHDSCPRCPGDDDLAAWCDRALAATATRAIEDHALVCAALRLTLSAISEARAPAEPGPLVRVLASIRGRALALLNSADLVLRELSSGGAPAPSLGMLRGGLASDGLVSIQGPGAGLDALDLQVQSDGSLRLTVSGRLPRGPEGELRAVVLEADGVALEKRPYSGQPVALGPIERGGRYRVAVVARRPGRELRSLGEAHVDLTA